MTLKTKILAAALHTGADAARDWYLSALGKAVETTVRWGEVPKDRIYETHPKKIGINIALDSPDQVALIETARKGCFIEQTLGQTNRITHSIRTETGFRTVP